MTDTIVLLDGISDVKKLERYTRDSSTKKICFDYNSYKTLNASCAIVEEYFDEKDRIFLNDFAVEITTNWYKNKEIEKDLEIKEINIGYLLELELLPYFFHQLKRFIGVTNAVKKESPKKIITASLGNFVLPMNEIEHVNRGNNTSSGLYYDNIEIPIRIGNSIRTFKISRRRYQSIKKFVDVIISSLFLKKFSARKNNKKNILFLEFNPENYSNLLESLSDQGHNLILLNQRRPAITNLSSLKTVRRTKCKICYIGQDLPTVNQNLFSLWSKDIFEKIFSVNGNSFWKCIKDDFVRIIENRYPELMNKITLAESLLNNTKIDAILDWAHTATEEKIISVFAHARNIPIITLQHGAYPTNEKFVKYLPFQPIIPSHNKIAVWGNVMKDYVTKYGGTNNNIISIGSPKHDKFFWCEKKRSNAVLIVVSELYHSNFEGTSIRAFEDLDEYVSQLFVLIKKLSDKKIIMKLRPGQASYDIQSIIDRLGYKIPIYKMQDIFDVMQMCDTVISMNFSTAILDAMILNKPTMTIFPEKQGYEHDVIMKSGATLTVSNIKELESRLKDILTNEELRRKLIKSGQNVVNEYYVNHGKASVELARFISSLL